MGVRTIHFRKSRDQRKRIYNTGIQEYRRDEQIAGSVRLQ